MFPIPFLSQLLLAVMIAPFGLTVFNIPDMRQDAYLIPEAAATADRSRSRLRSPR